jgi:hypothetical protein
MHAGQAKRRLRFRGIAHDALRLMLSPDDDDSHVARGQSEPLDLILAS